MNSFLSKLTDLFVVLLIIFSTIFTFVVQISVNKNTPLLVDTEFYPFLKQFEKDSEKYQVTPNFKNMTTTFVSDISGEVLAYCIPKFNIIKVSRKKWNTLDTLSKKIVLYHEWGHCTLKREHVEDTYPNYVSRCPDSIMHPYMDPVVKCYNSNTDWYDKELFTNFNNRETIP